MKKINKLTWILVGVVSVDLIGMMIAFGWIIVFPLAIFCGALYFVLKRVGLIVTK